VVVDNGGDGVLDLDYFIQQGQPYAANACVKTGGISKYDVGADCDVIEEWDTDELFAVYTTMSKIYNTKKAAYESEFGEAFKLSDMAEVRQLCERGTITPMPRSKVPAGEQIYESVCTRQMKCNESGVPVKPKSRLAMNGKSQTRREPGIEFANTRTICPRMGSCRCYFSKAAAKGSTCYDFDIPNAFGQAEEDKVRYMRLPFDMRKYDENGDEIVFRVLNLYGGRTAGRNYQDCFVKWITSTEIGFCQNPADPSTFYREAKPAQSARPARPVKRDRHGNVTQPAQERQPAVPAMAEISAFAWIDDINYETTDGKAHEWFSNKLVTKWDPNHEKDPPSKTDFVIGIKVVQKDKTITLLQPQLATKLLESFPQVYGKKTPFKAGQNTAMCDEGELLTTDKQKLYRRGSAIITYLACCTRPDLAYAASQLGKVQSCPKQKHMDMLEHCVGYVKNTINFGIQYGTPKHEQVNRVHGHVDSPFSL
jgi:hypothetical protein